MKQEAFAFLDFKSVVMHCMYAGTDRDQRRSTSGNPLISTGHTLDTVLTMYILPLLEQGIRLNNIIGVQDAGKIYRQTLFPGYKGKTRIEDPEVAAHVDFSIQQVEEMFYALGIPMCNCDGVEADDVLAYLAKTIDGPKLIYTTDQDILQLASPKNQTAVFLKLEPNEHGIVLKDSNKQPICVVPPKHVALMKSIVGDTSDNYGGVKGMGPTAYAALAEAFGEEGLDELAAIVDSANFTSLDEAVREYPDDKALGKLSVGRWEWRTGWLLAQLRPQLVGAFRDGAFRRLNWKKRLPSREALQTVATNNRIPHIMDRCGHVLPTFRLVDMEYLERNPDFFGRLHSAILTSPYVAFDFETSDERQDPVLKEVGKRPGSEFVDVLSSSVTGSGLTFGDNLQHTVYLSYDHADTHNLGLDKLEQVLEMIPEGMDTVIQYVNFELAVMLVNLGACIGNTVDTKAMSVYVDENRKSHGLKQLSKDYLQYTQLTYAEVVPKGLRMKDISAKTVFKYGADDPWVTAHLFDLFRLMMMTEGTYDFFMQNERLPREQLAQSFVDGVSFNLVELERQKQEDEENYALSVARIRELIRTYQTPESIASGIARLDAERWPEFVAKKAAKNEPVTEEDRAAFIQDLHDKVAYQDREITEEVPEWNLTPAASKSVFEKAGIGDCFGISTKFLQSYKLAKENSLSREAMDFLDMVIAAAPFAAPAKRQNPLYQALVAHVKAKYIEPKQTATGHELNLGSPKQNQELLYGMLDLPIRVRQFELSQTQIELGLTVPSAQTDKDAIAAATAEDTEEGGWKREALLCLKHAIECSTRLKMFYIPYPKWVHPYDGLIHPQIDACGTETRRPSGTSPNPLQWPKRGDGVKFRRCIIPNQKLGHNLIVSIDWSQQELRIGAGLSWDEKMLDCFIGSDVEHAISPYVRELLGEERYARLVATPTKDMHTITAAAMLGKPYEDVAEALAQGDYECKATRTKAKPVNFGSAYNIGAGKLSRQLLIKYEVAKSYLQAKKEEFFGFEQWRGSVEALAYENGFVQTVFGNRRHVFEDIRSSNGAVKSHCQRSAVNFMIQGLCADSLKEVLSNIIRAGIFERTGASLIAPIYDELVFSVHSSNAVDLILSVHKLMTKDVPGIPVPMLAEPSLGLNFGDQIEIGPFPTETKVKRAVAKAFGTWHVFSKEPEDVYFETFTAGEYDHWLQCPDAVELSPGDEAFKAALIELGG